MLLLATGCSEEADPRIRQTSAEVNQHVQKTANRYWMAPTVGTRLRVADNFFRDIPDRVQYLDDLVQGREPGAAPVLDSKNRKAEVVWPR